MNHVVITTRDSLLSSLFWTSFRLHRKSLITKVIVLPDRQDIDFPGWFKGFAFLRILGLRGILKLLRFRLFSSTVSVFSVCEEVLVFRSLDQEALLKELRRAEVDVLISVGAPIIFSADILSVPSRHCLNIHNGDIRQFRGHFSTFWEVLTAQEHFCLTLHEMEGRVDSGAVYERPCKERAAFRNLQEVMFWKKETGGAILARALNKLDESGALIPEREATTRAAVAKYYPFPSVGDVLRFRF